MAEFGDWSFSQEDFGGSRSPAALNMSTMNISGDVTAKTGSSFKGKASSSGSSFKGKASSSFWAEAEVYGKAVAKGMQAGGEIAAGYFKMYQLMADADGIERAQREEKRRLGVNVRALRRGRTKTISKQTEQFVAAGVKLKGSALDVMADTFKDFMDKEMIMRHEHGFRQAERAGRAAGLRRAAKTAKKTGYLRAAGSLLGG